MEDLSRVARAGAAIIGVLSSTACVRQLPPAATPETIAPPGIDASAALEAGHGRLVVDVVDGPTSVQQVRMTSQQQDDGLGHVSFRFSESPEVLCATSPCVADVPEGNVLLGFPVIGNRDLEVELVHVGPEVEVYRRSLSVYRNDTGALRVIGIVAASLGSAATITGICLLPVGLGKDNDDLATAGAIVLGAGLVITTFGIWAIRHDAPTYRPGAANHFSLGGG
jgi:hypothetical protein